MSTIEYAQRLLNAGELEEAELEGILQGRVTEQALRSRGKKVDVDTHPARTAMLMVAKTLPNLDGIVHKRTNQGTVYLVNQKL